MRGARDVAGAVGALIVFARAVPSPQITPPDVVITQSIRERWINSGQASRSVQFTESRYTHRLTPAGQDGAVAISTIGGGSDGRSDFGKLDSLGALVSAQATVGGNLQDSLVRLERASAAMTMNREFGVNRFEDATAVWDLLPPVAPGTLAIGMRWTDSTVAARTAFGCTLRLSVARVSRVVALTRVGGRPVLVVAESAFVHMRESTIIDDLLIAAPDTIDRDVTGTLRGRVTIGAETRQFVERADTMRLVGTARLTDPTGKVWTSPTAFERTREIRTTSDDASATQFATALVLSPLAKLDQRLRSRPNGNDPALHDSVFAAWRSEPDPDTHTALGTMLGAAAPNDAAFIREVLRDAQRDSDFSLLSAALAPNARLSADTTVVSTAIRIMRDPRAAFVHGVQIDWLARTLIAPLVTDPQAGRAIGAPAIGGCVGQVCTMLEHADSGSDDPRVHLVALVARATADPRTWGDSLIQFAATGPIVRAYAMIVRPVPVATASWREWLQWLSECAPPGGCGNITLAKWPGPTGSSLTSLHLGIARSQRDVPAELRRHLATTTDDSGRVVLEGILVQLGQSGPSPSAVIASMRRTDTTGRWAARAEMAMELAKGASWDNAISNELMERTIRYVLDRRMPGASLDSAAALNTGRLAGCWDGKSPMDVSLPLRVSPELRSALGSRISYWGPDTGSATPDTVAHQLVTLYVHHVDGFAQVDVTCSRYAGKGPRGPWRDRWPAIPLLFVMDRGQWTFVGVGTQR